MAETTNPVNWFEIPVDDLDRATAFYQGVFEVTLQPLKMGDTSMAMFPMAEGPNASGALVHAEGYTPSHEGSVVYFTVNDIEDTLGRVNAHGGDTIVEKMSIGQFGFIAHFEDSEGNRVALHSTS